MSNDSAAAPLHGIVLSRIDEQIADIQRKIVSLQDDPANAGKPGSIWKYTPKTHKKLDKLAMDITHLIAEKRALQGNPVDCPGYSGRQTNRR
jgi:hypothetical protein